MCRRVSLEKPVSNLLTKKNVKFDHNKGLEGCRPDGARSNLRPDFIFNDAKLCFELDGQHHFFPIHGDDEFDKRVRYDTFKNNFLKEHGYILIRVTSSPTKEWGTEKHITLKELFNLIDIGINDKGEVNLEVFKPYDFNRN